MFLVGTKHQKGREQHGPAHHEVVTQQRQWMLVVVQQRGSEIQCEPGGRQEHQPAVVPGVVLLSSVSQPKAKNGSEGVQAKGKEDECKKKKESHGFRVSVALCSASLVDSSTNSAKCGRPAV